MQTAAALEVFLAFGRRLAAPAEHIHAHGQCLHRPHDSQGPVNPIGANGPGKQQGNGHPHQEHAQHAYEHGRQGLPLTAYHPGKNNPNAHTAIEGSQNPNFVHSGLHHRRILGEQAQHGRAAGEQQQ